MKRIVISLLYCVAFVGIEAHPMPNGAPEELIGLRAELDARQHVIRTTIRKMKNTTAKMAGLVNSAVPTSSRAFSNLLQFSLLSLDTLTDQVRIDSHELIDYTQRLHELRKELAHIDVAAENEATKATLMSLKNELENMASAQDLEIVFEQQKTLLKKIDKQKVQLTLLQTLLEEKSLYQATQVFQNLAANIHTLEVSTC